MFSRIKRLYQTLKYLKPVQVEYRIRYKLRSYVRKVNGFSYPISKPSSPQQLKLSQAIPSPVTYTSDSGTFQFINQKHSFGESIDWNFSQHGKLWTYNLNYFAFLHQPDLKAEEGVKLIQQYIEAYAQAKEGKEPYTISLRGIHWIKFLTQHQIADANINDSLLAQYYILLDNLEYQHMANHLIENGFSLLFGAVYFNDAKLMLGARTVLFQELREQYLDDGAHFERSPMYHAILLERLLDCYNLLINNPKPESGLLALVEYILPKALGWLKEMHMGSIQTYPQVNDSSDGTASSYQQLEKYANDLGIEAQTITLGDSGYRKVSNPHYELIADVGDLAPDYNMAHAQSDTFHFDLAVRGRAVLVDTGISTYVIGDTRSRERSTQSHNTVMVAEQEQSDVWASHRVGRRAHILHVEEKPDFLSASHDGYKHLGITHQRTWEFREKQILVTDQIESSSIGKKAEAFFHLAEGLDLQVKANQILVGDIVFKFTGAMEVKPFDYQLSKGFNKTVTSKGWSVTFSNQLVTEIVI